MTVIVDEQGVIVTANEAWRRFGRENGAGPAVAEGVGQDYFAICRDGAMAGCPRGSRAPAGITRVLRRELPIFTLDYASHGSDDPRWFTLIATPLEGGGAVIAHSDVTERRRTEMSAAALIETGRELAGGLEPADVARQIATSVVRVFAARHATVFRLEPEGGRLVCIAAAGAADAKSWHGRTVGLGEGAEGRAAAEERSVWTPDVLSDPKISLPEWAEDAVRAAGFRSVLAMPLKSGRAGHRGAGLGDGPDGPTPRTSSPCWPRSWGKARWPWRTRRCTARSATRATSCSPSPITRRTPSSPPIARGRSPTSAGARRPCSAAARRR